jgi:hypothetical protein
MDLWRRPASDKPEGWGESRIQAIDYKTGKVKWSHKWEDGGRSGLLSTAGKLLFAGDGSGNLVALDPANRNPLCFATSKFNMLCEREPTPAERFRFREDKTPPKSNRAVP